MIAALIGIQTTCVVVATSYVINHFRPRKANFKVSSNSNGFKHYKTI
jgi:hypothetical protein